MPDFLDAVASRTPAPGGGSVSAIAAAMAAALVEMTARYSHDWAKADEVANAAALARNRLVGLAGEDAEAYASYLAADPSERAAALARATEVPARIAKLAGDLKELATLAHVHGNPNLNGDALVAVGLATAAETGAKQLVEINREKGG